jgi:hypothetical protein
MTDKILIDRFVVEQALEAFEIHARQYPHMVKGYTLDAEEALRAALEQSDIEIPASVPEGWKLVPVEPTNEMVQAWLDTYEGNIQTVYRAMLAAAPQPPVVEQPQVEQEPVAWIERWYGSGPERGWWIVCGRDHIAHLGPAEMSGEAASKIVSAHNTSPPAQRQPLTDQQIHDCFQHRHRDKATERRMITRAIEEAIWKKNS